MTKEQARWMLVKALRRAFAENGAPNSFSPGELERRYGGPPAKLAGRLGARHIGTLRLSPGIESLEYYDRKFRIDRQALAGGR